VRGSRLVAFAASILILMFAGHVLADGAYLRTDDRKKTFVWNNDPQPGDAAEWTGGRDSEGYAEGSGTLTWLRTQKSFATGSNIAGNKKVPISRYTGTMVHGKFVDAVTTVDHGKTYHAKFVDGQRKGNWSLGPIVAKATSVEATAEPEESKKASEPKIVAAKKVESPAEPKISEQAEPEPPTEGPDEAKPEVTSQKLAVSAPKAQAPLIAQASTEVDESATPRQQPVSRKAALAPGAVRAIEQPGRPVAKKSEKPKATSEKIRKATKVEEPKPEPSEERVESPAEGPGSTVAEKPQAPSSKITKAEKPEVTRPSTIESPPLAKETPVDDSIRTLTGPPAALRAKSAPPPETTPAAAAPTAPPTTAVPKLNAVNAMDIADIEARTKGYDLGEYQLPKAEYNPADDTWSVSYIPRDKDKSGKGLNVAVQDKTGHAEVKK
jgi:hypothetical protein